MPRDAGNSTVSAVRVVGRPFAKGTSLGKPTQPISGEEGQPVTLLHLVAVREVGERILAELVARQSGGATIEPVNGGTVEMPAGLVDLSLPAPE